MSNYKIRAHHGLCIQFFEGKGYSQQFVLKMKDVIENLNKNPYIQIVADKDIICYSCPNLENGVCNSQHKVSTIDKKVLSICGLDKDTIIKSDDFFKIVKEKIIKSNKLNYVCSNCEWFNICSKKQGV